VSFAPDGISLSKAELAPAQIATVEAPQEKANHFAGRVGNCPEKAGTRGGTEKNTGSHGG
jgi:hypothetical protein